MIRLHYSNRLEHLVAPLADSVAAHQRRNPLGPVTVIVPSRVVENFLRYRLAESLGIAANLKFPFLRTYLAEILNGADRSLTILDSDELQMVLFECLRSPAHRDDPELKPAHDYIGAGSKTEADLELRTLMLAGELARIFREYSISRRPMLRRWAAPHRADRAAMPVMERWQRHLWQLVFDSHGRVRPEWIVDSETHLMMLPDAFESIDSEKLRAALPSTLHIFGASYAGKAYAEIFARLGAATDLRIYALNPCREFWEDLDTSRRATLSGWARRADKIGAAIDDSEDPFALNADTDSPALRLWGRPGREYIRMLNETTQCDFVPLFSAPATTGDLSLFENFQESILDRDPARAQIAPGEGAPDDRSIRFLACPGIRRESEIAANAIMSTIGKDEEHAGRNKSERLRFHEIAVMLPDSALDEYVAHIDSVFRKHGIPIDLVNRRFSSASRVAEAVELLLALPGGRFARSEVVRLLTHPALAGDTGIDISAWPRWSEALGIFFGADDDDLKGTYIPSGLFQWDQGIRRLALGALMSSPRDERPQFFTAGASRYLPFEVPQDQLASAARFIRDARALIVDALAMRDARRTPREWSRTMVEYMNAYIRPATAADQSVRDRFLEAIESMSESTLRVGAISYAAAREMVAARIADFESRQGQLSGRGVAVGSLSSLRSIPFKVIFALGLNEGEFPARDRRDPMDLRTLKRCAGDVTPAERDRYLFLETILAARERLCLSYVSRDAKTGDPLEPSSVIRELQFILRGYVDAETLAKMTIEHPVSEYDLEYFPEFDGSLAPDRELETFDSDARAGARMVALRNELKDHAQGLALPEHGELLKALPVTVAERIGRSLRIIKPPESAATASRRQEIWLPLSALRKFLLCPLQATARYALGMFDEDDDSEEDDEPLEHSILHKSILLREVFWECGGDPALVEDKYKDALLLAQIRGQAPAGIFADAATIAHRALIERWIEKAQRAGAGDLAQWQDIRIGRADESFRADRVLDAIALDVDVHPAGATPYTQRVNLYGAVPNVSPNLEAIMQEVARKDVGARHLLPFAMHGIALSATGAAADRDFRVIIVGDNDGPAWVRKFAPMSREQARQYLARLAGDLLSGCTDYFLPIEAVQSVVAAHREGKDDDLEEKIEKVRDAIDNDKHYCSSCSGPLRKTIAHGFEPPTKEQILEIVKERYGPIAAIFDE